MSDIEQGGPLSPIDQEMYKQEYKQSAKLFEKALHEFESTDNMYKKAAFKDVMDKSMEVLNGAAVGLKDAAHLAQSQKIAQDYDAFQKRETPISEAQLRKDLKDAQKLD